MRGVSFLLLFSAIALGANKAPGLTCIVPANDNAWVNELDRSVESGRCPSPNKVLCEAIAGDDPVAWVKARRELQARITHAADHIHKMIKNPGYIQGLGAQLGETGSAGRVYQAKTQDGAAVVKVYAFDELRDMEVSIILQEFLGEMGLAPRVRGIIAGDEINSVVKKAGYDNDIHGSFGLVMDEVPSASTSVSNNFNDAAFDNEKTRAWIKRVANVLGYLRILPEDEQFLATKNGSLFLNDLDHFAWLSDSGYIYQDRVPSRPGQEFTRDLVPNTEFDPSYKFLKMKLKFTDKLTYPPPTSPALNIIDESRNFADLVKAVATQARPVQDLPITPQNRMVSLALQRGKLHYSPLTGRIKRVVLGKRPEDSIIEFVEITREGRRFRETNWFLHTNELAPFNPKVAGSPYADLAKVPTPEDLNHLALRIQKAVQDKAKVRFIYQYGEPIYEEGRIIGVTRNRRDQSVTGFTVAFKDGIPHGRSIELIDPDSFEITPSGSKPLN